MTTKEAPQTRHPAGLWLVELDGEWAVYDAQDVMVALFPSGGLNRSDPTPEEHQEAGRRARAFMEAVTPMGLTLPEYLDPWRMEGDVPCPECGRTLWLARTRANA